MLVLVRGGGGCVAPQQLLLMHIHDVIHSLLHSHNLEICYAAKSRNATWMHCGKTKLTAPFVLLRTFDGALRITTASYCGWQLTLQTSPKIIIICTTSDGDSRINQLYVPQKFPKNHTLVVAVANPLSGQPSTSRHPIHSQNMPLRVSEPQNVGVPTSLPKPTWSSCTYIDILLNECPKYKLMGGILFYVCQFCPS